MSTVTLAMGLLGSFLEATYLAWADFKEEYNVFVMGDAKSSLFSLGSHPKSIIARSTRSKVLEQARSLSAKYPKLKINFGYLPSQDLPADLGWDPREKRELLASPITNTLYSPLKSAQAR